MVSRSVLLFVLVFVTYATAHAIFDCAGVLNGGKELDSCGKCGGDNSTCTDCFGELHGEAKLDKCGVCNGDGTTCCSDYLDIDNKLWNFVLLPVAVRDMIERLENTRAVVEWISDNLPEEDELYVDLQYGDVAEINNIFNEQCLDKFCSVSKAFSTALEPSFFF